ncbi:MAG TPA: hypothetical protein VGE77_10990 [Nocardioides sp.]
MGLEVLGASVLVNAAAWQQARDDLALLLGDPPVSDGASWASYDAVAPRLNLGDETDVPPWALMVKVPDTGAAATALADRGWSAGDATRGGHETRVWLTSPAGLPVVLYAP